MNVNPLDNLFDVGNSFEEGRGRSLLLSMHKPRFPSISSSEYSEEYHIHVKRDSNRMDEDKPIGSIGNIEVEYASQGGQKNQISKAIDTTNNTLQQHVSSKDPALNSTPDNSMFNINLNYDINQILDPEE